MAARTGVDHGALAREALRYYGLQEPEWVFLRHNENITFRVTAANRTMPLLLRVHYSATENFDRSRQTADAVRSELMWLEALAGDGEITVQRPVRTRGAELISLVDVPGQGHVPCSVLEWIQGEVFPQESPAALDLAKRFGQMMADLHNHASAWRPPVGFDRPPYGADFALTRVEALRPGLQTGLFSEEDYRVLADAALAIERLVEPLGAASETWGLIHADLQGGNVLVHEQSVRPIDFSLCGFGHFLFDLGVGLPCLKASLRHSFLEGYASRRSLPNDSIRLIEAFAIAGIVSAFALHIPNPNSHEWLRRRIPVVAHEYCRDFLGGRAFLFEM